MKRNLLLLFTSLVLASGCGSENKKQDPAPAPQSDVYMRMLLEGKSQDWKTVSATESTNGSSYTFLSVKGAAADGSQSVTIMFEKPKSQTWETASASYMNMNVKTATKNVTFVGGKATLKYNPATQVYTGTFTTSGGTPSVDNGTFQVKK